MRIAYTEQQFQRYSESGQPFALPLIDCGGFHEESTDWLCTLLHGSDYIAGWYGGLAMARLRVLCGREHYQEKIAESLWFIAGIESELDYRLNGELLPSGD